MFKKIISIRGEHRGRFSVFCKMRLFDVLSD